MKNNFYILFVGLFLWSCSGSKETNQGEHVQINPEFARYISAFTGGTIASDAAIKVQFNKRIELENQLTDADLFEL